MTFQPIDVEVRGDPAVWTAPASVAEPWKQAVEAAVLGKWQGGYLTNMCAVGLRFELSEARCRDTALFNLLKATVDGLGAAVFSKSHKGKPGHWNREDWRVVDLYASKQITEGPPGVRVEIYPDVPGTMAPGSQLLASGHIDGDPPVLPGDAAGAVKASLWREDLQRHLHVDRPPGTDDLLVIDLRFVVAPRLFQSTDLDNYCVPAAQAACSVVFGGLKDPWRIVQVHAVKALATLRETPGTEIQIWRL